MTAVGIVLLLRSETSFGGYLLRPHSMFGSAGTGGLLSTPSTNLRVPTPSSELRVPTPTGHICMLARPTVLCLSATRGQGAIATAFSVNG